MTNLASQANFLGKIMHIDQIWCISDDQKGFKTSNHFWAKNEDFGPKSAVLAVSARFLARKPKNLDQDFQICLTELPQEGIHDL